MRPLLVPAIAAAATAAGVAYATQSTGPGEEGPPFELRVSPAHQSAARGQTMTFSVTIERAPGFDEPVTLEALRLPAGSRARWTRHDGTGASVLGPDAGGAVLTLRTTRRTPVGNIVARVRASAAGHARSRELKLAIEHAKLHAFSLQVRPARQTVAPGATITYTVRIVRRKGFRGRVALDLVSVPSGGRIKWATPRRGRRATLALRLSPQQQPRALSLVVRGTARVGGRRVRRDVALVLVVAAGRHFPIAGDVSAPLHPGRREAIDLSLTNPHRRELRVTSLAVSLGPAAGATGCGVPENYEITQYSGPYPIPLPPGTARLSALVDTVSALPQLAMRDLPENQDACKGASLTLELLGIGTR